jgi:hypothetical protein
VEERFVPIAQGEARPIEASTDANPAAGPRDGLSDPRALQILSTEHWSLLTARSLVYNETFARGGMFLALLSATLLVLGLISTATDFRNEFLIIAALLLALDLFVGLATVGRINGAGAEDLRYLQGMNRLRHAYLEMVPGLERYFITSKYDDFESVAAFYGPDSPSAIRGILHGMTTMPVMISVICCAIAAVLTAVLVLLATGNGTIAAVAAIVAFAILFIVMGTIGFRSAMRFSENMPAMFPRPASSDSDEPPRS